MIVKFSFSDRSCYAKHSECKLTDLHSLGHLMMLFPPTVLITGETGQVKCCSRMLHFNLVQQGEAFCTCRLWLALPDRID